LGISQLVKNSQLLDKRNMLGLIMDKVRSLVNDCRSIRSSGSIFNSLDRCGYALNPARPGPVASKAAQPGLKTGPARKTCLGRLLSFIPN